MTGKRWAWILRSGFIVSVSVVTQAGDFPPPRNVGPPESLGLGVQRTMNLLATSTPEHRHTVRILFYGQSITQQSWWKLVADDLKRRFPHANLVIENRALGGFSSQRLVKTAETDLYPFYPDLVIFHVYGSHLEYEKIIRRARARTTAEILIQTDHVTADTQLAEETDPAKARPGKDTWNSFMNYSFLPETAKKYGCGLLDQRSLWKSYLKENQLSARALLRDEVHLNDHGCYLMAELVKAYLVPRSDAKLDPMNCETVKTMVVGSDVFWREGKLALSFEGNRVDVVVKAGNSAPAKILIDRKLPSEIPELYGFTRALSQPGGKWPVLVDLSWSKPLQIEEWTLQAARDLAGENLFTFRLSGSKTGPDGAGRSDRRFVSASGRIVIDPGDWDVAYALGLAGVKPAQFTVHWQVVPHFVDSFIPPGINDKTIETVVTLAQGLKPGKHTLEISGDPRTPIAAIRIYRPPLPKE